MICKYFYFFSSPFAPFKAKCHIVPSVLVMFANVTIRVSPELAFGGKRPFDSFYFRFMQEVSFLTQLFAEGNATALRAMTSPTGSAPDGNGILKCVVHSSQWLNRDTGGPWELSNSRALS